jgi:predicted phage terminase large subunit-like protein
MDFSKLSLAQLATGSPAGLLWVAYRETATPWLPYKHSLALDNALLDVVKRTISPPKPDDDPAPSILLNSIPVQHGKTQLASVGFTVWLLGNWPDLNVAAISHTAGFARDNIGSKARALFERVGKEIFGLEIDPRSDAGDRWSIKGRRGGFFSDGVGGRIEGNRIDVALLDDVIGSLPDAMSAKFRNDQWEWYRAQLFPRLAPRAAIVNTMSRWHQDDLAGRMLEAGKSGEGPMPAVLDLPAIALTGSEYASGCDPLGRKPGEALWPEVRSLAFLEGTRRSIGARNFEARFQGRPRPAEGNTFKREWYKYYDRTGDAVMLRDARGIPSVTYSLQQLLRFGMVDLASSDGRGDYTVITSFGMGPKGELIVLDVFRGQVPATRHLELLWQAKARLGLSRIGIESVAYQAALFQAALADGLPVVEMKRGRGESKLLRAQNAAVMYEQGNVWHPRSAPWIGDLESELEDFPTGAHDDQVDTISDAATVVLELKARGGAGKAASGVRV